MGNYEFLFQQYNNFSTDSSIFRCPLCNAENKYTDKNCVKCGYDLQDYEKLCFSTYNFYNQALNLTKQGNYLSAFEYITRYLEYFKYDKDACRLQIFIVYLLKGNYAEKVDDYCTKFPNERWIRQFEENPESITIDQFSPREEYIGKTTDNVIEDLKNELRNLRSKKAYDFANLINPAFSFLVELRANSNSRDGKKFYEKFLNFYENNFLKCLDRNGLSVKDLVGKNYEEQLKNGNLQQEEIGKIIESENKKLPDGTIDKVFNPCIKYHSEVLQKMNFSVVNNKRKRK